MANFNFGSNAGNVSTGFGFGAPRPAAPAFGATAAQPSGSITFGTPLASVAPTQPSTGFGFGSTAPTMGGGLGFGSTAAAAPSTGLSFGAAPKLNGFGAPVASAAPTFGTPNLSFGATTSNTTGGLSFGAPAASGASTLTFNPPAASSGLSFGAPAANTGLGFGTPAATNTGMGFGTPAATGTGMGFGAPAATGTGMGFGAPAATGLGFGTPASTGTGLGFGTPTASTGLGFGTPAATGTGLGFGTATATNTGLGFSAPAATNTGLSFGGTTPNINFNLGGATATTSATPSLFSAPTSTPAQTGLGGLSFNPTPASSASTGFGLGTLGAASSAPTLSFGTTTSAANTGLGFGLGGTLAASKAPTLSFTAPLTSTGTGLNFGFNTPAKPATTALTTTPTIGLGGIDGSANKTGTVTTGQVNTIAAKENTVPNEIIQLIDSFKHFVKDQKAHSSDVARGSEKPFRRVGEEIDHLSGTLSDVGNELQRNQQLADKLKHDSAKTLHNAEMAQRTFETPPGLQFENTAPLQYFIELVNKFEQELQGLRLQIDTTDKHIRSLHEPKYLTSQELAQGMRKLHDTFVALAGRLQSVHTQVDSQKDQYLNLRKYILKDPTDIFLQKTKEQEAMNIDLENVAKMHPRAERGPTPFSTLGSPFGVASNTSVQPTPSKPPPAYPTSGLSFSTPAATPPSTLGQAPPATGSLFGGTPAATTTTTDASGFQLQNPPLGSKRGKR